MVDRGGFLNWSLQHSNLTLCKQWRQGRWGGETGRGSRQGCKSICCVHPSSENIRWELRSIIICQKKSEEGSEPAVHFPVSSSNIFLKYFVCFMSYAVWESSTALSMRRRKQTQVLANMLWETKLAKSVEKLAEFCQIRQLCIFWTISKYFRLILEKSGWCQKFNLYTWQRSIGRVFLKMIFDITTVASLSHRHLITVGKHLSSGHARFHLHKTSKVNFFLIIV